MKRTIISLLLAVLCLLLCACGGEEPPEETSYAFLYKNVELHIGDKMPEVLQKLSGETPQISSSASCLQAVVGEDVIYRYAGFSLQSFRLSEGDADEQLRSIVLSDDSVATPEGISIGATGDAVKNTYGTPDELTDTRYTYHGKGMKLSFGLRDGRVTAIRYEIVD